MADLQNEIGSLLKEHHLTLATAESCTGGLLAHLITNAPGSSESFMGGIVSYSEVLKQRLLHVQALTLARHGAVSTQTAREMALGVCLELSTALGLSTTGLAGPDGDGSGKPVGLVYIGLASPQQIQVWEHHFKGDRQQIKRQAAQAALEHLRDYLQSLGGAA
ncbi:MAG: CinA family protein [Chloroflexi bacterium]|nr:CinA family protein [Chloroflexota bacterium]